MVVSLGDFTSLLWLALPLLLQAAIRRYRGQPQPQGSKPPKTIKPLTARPAAAIALLVAAAAFFALHATPLLAPENIYTLTGLTPSASAGLLFRRLAAARAGAGGGSGALTADDALLRDRLESRAARLLYLKYGPAVLARCPFCTSAEPTTYLLYAAPALARTHLLNAALLGAATSEAATGPSGARWRARAAWAAAALAAADAAALAAWDPLDAAGGAGGARALAELCFFHWAARAWRCGALAALDAALALVLFLAVTGRRFARPPTAAQRVDAAAAALAGVHMRLRAANVLRNTVVRDAELRAADAAYWAEEGVVMQEAMESEEVASSIKDAMEHGRLDPAGMEEAAEEFTRRVIPTG